ncbi:MAG: glycosyltransferase family 4 protein [Patescibacteria group bacterium]
MKVIMFSTDQSAFNEGSSFRARIIDYAGLFDELYVVVATSFEYGSIDLSERAHIISSHSKIKIFAYFGFYRIASNILKKDSDAFVVTSQEEFSGLVCALLKTRYRVPWQAQVHSDIFSPYFKKFSFKNVIRVFIASIILSYATRIRVVSKRIKLSIEQRGIRNPVDVLPIFIDVEALRKIADTRTFGESGFDFVFLILSRLMPEKNVTLAIEIFSEVIKKYPQTTLRIVGDGPLRAQLELRAASYKLGAHVQFEGWQKNISGYLKTADCFLSTSWYEGYGMSIVEAMAAKLPIIMTDVGVAGDLVVDNESGLVVPPGNGEALLEAMIRIRSKSNEELRERLGTVAYGRTQGILSRQEYLEKFQNNVMQCHQNKS